jgi:hypothetical protein
MLYIMNFLTQTKLSKEEWNKIEKPINDSFELNILRLINDGYYDENVIFDNFKSMCEIMKLDEKYDESIFNSFFLEKLQKINKKNCLGLNDMLVKKASVKLNKKDKIKIENTSRMIKNTNLSDKSVIEFIVMDNLENLQKSVYKSDNYHNDKKFNLALFNLHHLINNYKNEMNICLFEIMQFIIKDKFPILNIKLILKNVSKFLEHNAVLNCKKNTLFDHQKRIFNIFKTYHENSKLVFYCAQTSSGKTLTPIGLCNEYKVIFMCASKHIGLSLAKSAFNMKKKIGFAFGCDDTSKIRINFNAIHSYTEKKGRKVPDHSDGTNVELMICDVQSYEYAMLYMKAFHKKENILLFWDEPTIGLDVESHHLHNIISHNWKINQIPNIIFSCATLPKMEKMQQLVSIFKEKFQNPYVEYIETYDQLTNLCLYDDLGNIVMPHKMNIPFDEMKDIVKYHGQKYFKFYSCVECCHFILHYTKVIDPTYIDNMFKQNQLFKAYYIKELYHNLILEMNIEQWDKFIDSFNVKYPQNKSIEDNIFGHELTTTHSYTLTNGPTLYISDNIEKLCKYFMVKSQINKTMINEIYKKIDYNEKIIEELRKKEKEYEDKVAKFSNNDNIMTNMRLPPDVLETYNQIESLKHNLQELKIDNVYKPNTRDHFKKWAPKNINYDEADTFTSVLSNESISSIMNLQCLNKLYKFMIMLGIGIFNNSVIEENDEYINSEFIESENKQYVEIIKELAQNKSLYMILANSDYIYGTNYQFSHCYLGKDMKDMSQEKIIQCIGRIGRQVKNKHFSFRFRSDKNIRTLYSIPYNDTIEVINMKKLFC